MQLDVRLQQTILANKKLTKRYGQHALTQCTVRRPPWAHWDFSSAQNNSALCNSVQYSLQKNPFDIINCQVDDTDGDFTTAHSRDGIWTDHATQQ